MRICLISKEYPPETGWGGIGTFSYHLAHGLKDSGHNVEVVSLAAKTRWSEPVRTAEEDGVTVTRVPWEGGIDKLGLINRSTPRTHYMMKTNLALWNAFLTRHQSAPFDVVDTPELLAEGLLPGACKLVPLVIRLYTPHSKFISDRLNDVSSTFDHEFIATMERVAISQAEVLTSPSRDLAKFVAHDVNYPLEDIHIVGNPIDVTSNSPEGKKALRLEPGKTILFVGRLEERKGIDFLAAAIPLVVKEVPDAKFALLGADSPSADGRGSKIQELKDAFAAAGCSTNVSFLPRVPLAELPDYYRSADIFVAPSLYDNSPYTCQEAMACGVPVIGTSAGGTPEYVENGVSGLIVPPRDSKSLAEAIIKLLKSPEMRAEYGKNALEQVRTRYERTQIAQQMVELYQLAQSRFDKQQLHPLYRLPADDLSADTSELLFAYHKMLYDFVYTQSPEFRVGHWMRLTVRRPRLTLARSVVRIMGLLLRKVGWQPQALNRIAGLLEQKDQEREDALLKEIGAVRRKVEA